MIHLRKHSVILFFILTYLISWGTWAWVNGTNSELTGWIGLVAVIGAFGPSIAGFICAGLLDGWSGIRALLRKVVAWRVNWIVYLAVILGPPFFVLLAVVGNAFLGGRTPHWQGLLDLPRLFPTFLFMLLIGGLTEEPGWRWFALPIMRGKFGPLGASFIIGLVWGLWHIPIYSLPGLGNPLPTAELARFILSTPLLAILFTALAERSKDSVWIAILFHAWNNAVFTQLPNLIGVPDDAQLNNLYLFVLILVALPILWIWLRRSYPPTHRKLRTRIEKKATG